MLYSLHATEVTVLGYRHIPGQPTRSIHPGLLGGAARDFGRTNQANPADRHVLGKPSIRLLTTTWSHTLRLARDHSICCTNNSRRKRAPRNTVRRRAPIRHLASAKETPGRRRTAPQTEPVFQFPHEARGLPLPHEILQHRPSHQVWPNSSYPLRHRYGNGS